MVYGLHQVLDFLVAGLRGVGLRVHAGLARLQDLVHLPYMTVSWEEIHN